MSNEFSELERMMEDVSSMDTARMALRWALERLHQLERGNRDLDHRARSAESAQQEAEKKARDLEQTLASRLKEAEGRESFYRKLEETVALISEGKVDLAGYVREEVDLERARREMSEEYRKRYDQLDHAHREMVERWTQQLIEAQSYHPEKLAQALQRYDDLSRELDQGYQERLLALEQGFHRKEAEWLKREAELDADYRSKLRDLHELRLGLRAEVEAKEAALRAEKDAGKAMVESELARRREKLEAEFQERERRLGEEASALREQLHQNFQAQTQSWHKEELRRMTDTQLAWDAERQELRTEVQRSQERLQNALGRVGELQESLASSDHRDRGEIIRKLAETEQAFQQRLGELENAYAARRSELESAYEERLRVLEAEWDGRKEPLERAWEAEKGRILGDIAELRERFEGAQEEIRGLNEERGLREQALHRESLEQLAAKESQWTARLEEMRSSWEEEKKALSRTIEEREGAFRLLEAGLNGARDGLVETSTRAQAAAETLRTQMTREFQELLKTREAQEEARRKALEESWARERSALFEELEKRKSALRDMDKRLQEERERGSEAARLQAQAAEQAAQERLADEFHGKLKAMEALEERRRAASEEGWRAERERLNAELEKRDARLLEAQEQMRRLGELSAQRQEELLKAQSDIQEALERSARASLLSYQGGQENRLQELERSWAQERQNLWARLKDRETALQESREELRAARILLQDQAADMDRRAQALAAEAENRRKAEARQMIEARESALQEDWARKLDAVQGAWRDERKRFLEEATLLQKQIREAREGMEALRQRMHRQEAELLQGLESARKSWSDAESRARSAQEALAARQEQLLNAQEENKRLGTEMERQKETAAREYREHQEALLAACEEYRGRLESWEADLRSKSHSPPTRGGE